MSDTVVVSQFGARMHYAVPRIFEEAGQLERLYTDICAVRGWPRMLAVLPRGMLPAPLRRLSGRVPHGIPPAKIHTFEAAGMANVLRRMVQPTNAGDTLATLATARRVALRVARMGFGRAGGFYGISGESLELLRAARRAGMWTAVEQIIAPREMVDRLVEREMAAHPDWASARIHDPYARDHAGREKAEWREADIVVCPSEFVRRGVRDAGGPAERCVVVPYGVDAGFAPPPVRRGRDGPLRVLTVGAVGLRKGSPYVLEAARRLRGTARFRMVGPVQAPPARRAELEDALDLVGVVARAEIAAHYRWADVFLLPSVCEGSATAIYEALAAGLPVVTTPNAGSVVADGHDGFVVAAGDVEAMCGAITALAGDRAMVEAMGENARATAAAHDLAHYGERLLAALAPLRRPAPEGGMG